MSGSQRQNTPFHARTITEAEGTFVKGVTLVHEYIIRGMVISTVLH